MLPRRHSLLLSRRQVTREDSNSAWMPPAFCEQGPRARIMRAHGQVDAFAALRDLPRQAGRATSGGRPYAAELAERLEREHSFVARIELGERRVDVVELYWICEALGADAAKVAKQLMGEFAGLDG